MTLDFEMKLQDLCCSCVIASDWKDTNGTWLNAQMSIRAIDSWLQWGLDQAP